MNLTDIHKEIGTAKDNRNSPVHDWYRFTAGFSHKLVDKIILDEKLGADDIIYESFAGCGTTLVSAQKNGIRAVGNEGQELLFNVIQAKLNWCINVNEVKKILTQLQTHVESKQILIPYHKLLLTLYKDSDLYQLYTV